MQFAIPSADLLKKPYLNVFDIICVRNGYEVITYRKPGESWGDYQQRHARNEIKANRIKNKKAA